jgi:hypothetical protein
VLQNTRHMSHFKNCRWQHEIASIYLNLT